MSHKSLVRLLLVPCLLLAAAGCGALATPGAKPSIRIVSPATGSNFVTSGPTEAVTVRFSVSHFTLANSATTAQPGSGEIRLYENGKLWNILFSNSIKLSLAPGSYRFTAELTTNSKNQVVATSAPVVVSVSGGASATLPSWCNMATSLRSTGQPASTVSVHLHCLPAGDQFQAAAASPHGSPLVLDASGNLWFVIGSNVHSVVGVGRITPAGVFSVFSKGLPASGCLTTGGQRRLAPGPEGIWFACQGAIGNVSLSGTVSLFTKGLSTACPYPIDLTPGPGGAIWFACDSSTASQGLAIGRISPSGIVTLFTKGLPVSGSVRFSLQPWSKLLNQGGNLWFWENGVGTNTNMIGRISPAGTISVFTQGLQQACLGDYQSCLQPGPGNDVLFYIGSKTFLGAVGFGLITPTGVVTRFTHDLYPPGSCSAPTSTCSVGNLTLGAHGNIWFVGTRSDGTSFIGRVAPTGSVTLFTQSLYPSALATSCSAPSAPCSLGDLTLGPGGALWFSGSGGSFSNPIPGFIGRISPSGTVTLFTKGLSPSASCSTPTSCSVGSLTVGPDGNLWFSGSGGSGSNSTPGFIGRISPSGAVTLFTKGLSPSASCSTPTSCSVGSLTIGPGGDIWFLGSPDTTSTPPFIGKISPTGTITVFGKGLPAGVSLSMRSLPGSGGGLWLFGSPSDGIFLIGTVSLAGTSSSAP